MNELSEANASLQTKLTEAEAQMNELSEANTSLQSKLTETEAEMIALTEVHDVHLTKSSETEAEKAGLIETIETLQTKLSDAEKIQNTKAEENETLQTKLSDILEKVDALEALNLENEKALEDALSQNKRLSEENAILQQTIESIEEQAKVSEVVTENTSEEGEGVQTSGQNQEESNTTAPILRDNFTEPLSGIQMLYIPAGSFILGSETGEADEQPQLEMELGGYWIGETEVTNAQYRKCVEADGCDETNLMDIYTAETADYPVNYVTYRQAANFCSWIGGKLPTEYQWEKAARGSDGRTYPWGNEEPNTENNYAGIPGEFSDLNPVGSFPAGASPYGLLDMAGSVWEWTSSRYDPEAYSQDTDREAASAEGQTVPGHVIRGGSASPAEIDTYLNTLRTSYRSVSDSANYYLGFRCVIPDLGE